MSGKSPPVTLCCRATEHAAPANTSAIGLTSALREAASAAAMYCCYPEAVRTEIRSAFSPDTSCIMLRHIGRNDFHLAGAFRWVPPLPRRHRFMPNRAVSTPFWSRKMRLSSFSDVCSGMFALNQNDDAGDPGCQASVAVPASCSRIVAVDKQQGFR